MATIKKYNGSTWENAVVRKYGTASEIITPPTTIYTNGQPISTYSIKGNAVQNGTPTPSNPVAVNGVGNKTANLFDYKTAYSNYIVSNGDVVATNVITAIVQNSLADFIGQQITISVYGKQIESSFLRLTAVINGTTVYGNIVYANTSDYMKLTVTPETADDYWRISYGTAGTNTLNQFMINEGTERVTYEPYGKYKISILKDSSPLTPVYLNEPLLLFNNTVDTLDSNGTVTYAFRKKILDGTEQWTEYQTSSRFFYITLWPVAGITSKTLNTHFPTNQFQVVTGSILRFYDNAMLYQSVDDFKTFLAQQYAAGTPVTLYYILATSTTESVTAPSIPTTDGANTISVDTTVQPSEFTATWTGWHDASVKEKSENLIPTNISDWEQGGISSTTGIDTVSTIRLRTKGYYPIENDTDYYISVNDTDYCYVNIILYNSSKQYLGQYFAIDMAINGATALAINIPSSTIANVSYYRVVLKRQDENTILVNEISNVKPMLNSGSTALTYAPYWK